MKPPTVVLSIAVVTSFVLGACKSILPSPARSPDAPEPGEIAPAIYASDLAFDALLRGRLTVEDDCLFIEGEGDARIGLGWPVGTTWNPARETITTSGREATVGEVVEIGGGRIDVVPGEVPTLPWVRAPDPECLGDALWLVSGVLQDDIVSSPR